MGSKAIVTQEPGETQAVALLENPPAVVLAEAQIAAKALQGIIAAKPKKVVMNGEQYLEFEDWQTVGRFYGVTAKEDGDPEFVNLGGIQGFKASAVAVDRYGREIGRATAYCLNDEEKWRGRTKYDWLYVTKSGKKVKDDPGSSEIIWEPNPNKPGKSLPKKVREATGEEAVPLFQLASMAQTRASAKALRNVLSWVVVLAGYRPTPAEELEGERQATEPPPAEHGPRVVDAEVVEAQDGRAFEVDASGRLDATKPSIPPDGSPAWTDPMALGAECLRLSGGDKAKAGALLTKIAGVETVRGMPASKVLGGWSKLADVYAEVPA